MDEEYGLKEESLLWISPTTSMYCMQLFLVGTKHNKEWWCHRPNKIARSATSECVWVKDTPFCGTWRVLRFAWKRDWKNKLFHEWLVTPFHPNPSAVQGTPNFPNIVLTFCWHRIETPVYVTLALFVVPYSSRSRRMDAPDDDEHMTKHKAATTQQQQQPRRRGEDKAVRRSMFAKQPKV